MTNLARAIGARIRAAREIAGLSQRELGAQVGLSHVGLGDLERGKNLANIAHLIELSSILGRSVEHFLGLDNGLTPDQDGLLTLYKNLPTDRARRLALRSLRAHAEAEREEDES